MSDRLVLLSELQAEWEVAGNGSRFRDFLRRRAPEVAIHGTGKYRGLTRKDADVLRELYKRNNEATPVESKLDRKESGDLYLLHLVPDWKLERIKVGYSDRLNERLAEHRTVAPTLKLLHSWPCLRSWEKAAIAAIARGEKQIGVEVFDFTDITAALKRGDKFFRLLPRVENTNGNTNSTNQLGGNDESRTK